MEQLQKRAKVERRLCPAPDPEPTAEEVARESGFALREVGRLRQAGRHAVSRTPAEKESLARLRAPGARERLPAWAS